jgi:hypothetical protein
LPGFYGRRQADIGLACQAFGAEAIARLDQIVAALPVVGAFFGTSDHSGTGQTGGGLSGCYRSDAKHVVTLIVGELLKLVLVERLFSLTRDKLMKIPAFAWAYTKFLEAKAWLKNTEAWQAIRTINQAARQYLTEMKKSVAVAFR